MTDPNARCAFCGRGPEGLDGPIGGLRLCTDERSCEATCRAREQKRKWLFRVGAFGMLVVIAVVEVVAWAVFR